MGLTPDPAMAGLLADLLREAAGAHHAHEQATGKPDPDWPEWYADYLMRHHGYFFSDPAYRGG